MQKLIRLSSIFFLLLIALAFSCSDVNDIVDPEPDPEYSHTEPPGHSANDFLSGNTFTGLTVEVDYMAGYEPNMEALNTLKNFFQQRLNKLSVTILAPTEIAAQGEDTYTAEEIRSLEEEHRDNFTEEKELTAYVIIVDGKYAQGNVLGIAYYNTSTAFFGTAIEQISGGLTQPSRYEVEASVFRHEFGHLFGLVAIEGSGTEMQQPHQDAEHGHHCDNDQCLMYYAVESTELFGSIFTGDIPQLDQNCINDLQANGGK